MDAGEKISRLLEMARAHLGMDVAFVSQFTGGERLFRYVDAAGGVETAVRPGAGDPLRETYCQLIVEGAVPAAIADAWDHEALRSLDVTDRLAIRGYCGAPVVLPDGQVYGTLCAFRSTPHHDLAREDVKLLGFVGRLIGEVIGAEESVLQDRRVEADSIDAILGGDGLDIVFQPIVDVVAGEAVGYEALSRFRLTPRRRPDQWFALAASLGKGVALELHAVAAALTAAAGLPGTGYVSVNASPPTFCSPVLIDLVGGCARPVVVELTEHEAITDLGAVLGARARLAEAGVGVALDDAGAGYAGLITLVDVGPDIIKLDRALVAGIDTSAARQAMATAAVHLRDQSGTRLVAEGVERPEEVATLVDLGLRWIQGYVVAPPLPLEDLPGSWARHRAGQPYVSVAAAPASPATPPVTPG